jgi:hypothetical protein
MVNNVPVRRAMDNIFSFSCMMQNMRLAIMDIVVDVLMPMYTWFIPLFGEKVRILEETATLQPEEFCWRWQGNARTSTVSVTRGARTHVGQRRD